MQYRRCGKSGVRLPAISLGLWHNFGGVDTFENSRDLVRRAFDLGITHFDLANNYGPPPGSAESNFGEILRLDLKPWRDELIISSKAGWDMWPGPYGNWGSRKYLLASLDQSLKRMGLEYVDIFYSHRPDPETPIEETMGALDQAVRSGKALYAGISSYDAKQTAVAAKILRELGTPCLIHQPKYSMFDRWVENGLRFTGCRKRCAVLVLEENAFVEAVAVTEQILPGLGRCYDWRFRGRRSVCSGDDNSSLKQGSDGAELLGRCVCQRCNRSKLCRSGSSW